MHGRFSFGKLICLTLALSLLLWAYPGFASGKIALPGSTHVIGEEAFCGLQAADVILPEGVVRIESRAFAQSAVQSISLPESLSYIAPDAFQGCSGFTAFVWESSYAHFWCQQNSVAFRLNQADKPLLPAATVNNLQKTNDGRVKLSWSAVDGASGYAVFEHLGSIEVLVLTTRGTDVYLAGLTPGVHEYVVRAYDTRGSLFNSGEASSAVAVTVAENEFAETPVLSKVDETIATNRVELKWQGSALKYTVLEIFENGTEMEIQTKSYKQSVIGEYSTTITDVATGNHTYAVRAVYADNSMSTSSQWQVQVYGPAESISLDTDHIEMQYNDRYYKLQPLILPKGTRQNAVQYTTSDASVATVTTGTITAKGAGTATITATVIGTTLSASCTVTVHDFNYSENGLHISHGVVTAYTGNESVVTIPEGVYEIGEFAFYNKQDITEIRIPNTVTTISDGAFCNCTALTTIQIPDSVTFIGTDVFNKCKSLTYLPLSRNMASIGDSMFSGCDGLTSVVIPNWVSKIGSFAFFNCKNLVSVTMPDSVTSVGLCAFQDCDNLERVSLSDRLTTITKSMFQSCKKLESVNLPEDVTRIEDDAFYWCSNLKDVTFHDHLDYIGVLAFSGTSLTAVSLPNSVTVIGDEAFASCRSMSSLRLSNNLTSLADGAFEGCDSLTSVVIPGSVENFGIQCFCSCDALSSVVIGNGVTHIGEEAFAYCDALTSVTLPGSLTAIGSYAFAECTALESIYLPSSLTRIGDGAFKKSALKEVTIPGSVSAIETSAFQECKSLTRVTMRNGVYYIGRYAFHSCIFLTYVEIPVSVTTIEPSAFSSCYNLSNPVVVGDSTGVAPTGITALPGSIVIAKGTAHSLTVAQTPVDALEPRCSYESLDPSIASWDQVNERVVGKGVGKTSIRATSYNGLTCTCEVTVLPAGYTETEWETLLARIDNEYSWMAFFETFLNGGGVNPNGVQAEGIDLSGLTKNIIQTGYSYAFGDKAGTAELQLTKGIVIFHSIMNELSTQTGRVGIYETAEVVKSTLSTIDMSTDAYNALISVVNACNYAGYFSDQDFDYDFVVNRLNKDTKLELKELSVAGKAFNTIRDFVKGIELYVKYSSVADGPNRHMALEYAEALKASGDATLGDAAKHIEMYLYSSPVERLTVLLGYNGLLPFAEKTAVKLIEKGIGVGVTKLASLIPEIGPFAIGAATGIVIGKIVNDLTMNVDGIQRAAFKAQYAIDAVGAYRSTFDSAYTAFRAAPLSRDKFNNFASSYLAYRELLGEAYDAFAELPKAMDEAALTELWSLITDLDCSEAISSSKSFASMARTYMDYDLGEYGSTFFPGLEIVNYLNH